MELINCHIQACETKPRTRNPFAKTRVENLKAKAVKAAQEASKSAKKSLSQQGVVD